MLAFVTAVLGFKFLIFRFVVFRMPPRGAKKAAAKKAPVKKAPAKKKAPVPKRRVVTAASFLPGDFADLPPAVAEALPPVASDLEEGPVDELAALCPDISLSAPARGFLREQGICTVASLRRIQVGDLGRGGEISPP